jgi:hypothetical protein
VEANCGHHIPIILNGKIYPKAGNKLEGCAIIGNARLVNEVSENNLPLTGNLWMQTPNKNKSRLVILSDSHLRECTKRINNCLSDKFRAFGWMKPGVLAKKILDRITVDLVNLKKRNVIVISAGAGNVYRNNPNKALMNTIKFIQNNGNTNIMKGLR